MADGEHTLPYRHMGTKENHLKLQGINITAFSIKSAAA
jgi:hypothetical protein